VTSDFVETGRPQEARGFIHKRAFGFIKRNIGKVAPAFAGFIPGGGIATGLIGSAFGGQGPALPQFTPQLPAQPRGSVTPVQLPPTPTITTPIERAQGTEFQAVTGAFGLPAMAPFAIMQTVLDCPRGMVLGKDDLCYPSAVLRRNSQFRKWRSAPRPTVTRRDERALARIDSVQKALKRLGKKAGLKVTG